MSHELTKMDKRELHEIAKSINDREEVINQLRGKTEDAARTTVTEAILQGQEMLKAKAMIPYGLFLPWLKSNCPLVKISMAYRYMKLAADPELCAAANSIKAALKLCDQEEEKKEERIKKSCSPDLQSLYLFNRAMEFVTKHPIDKYPEETKAELRKELEPMAARLWPEKFTIDV